MDHVSVVNDGLYEEAELYVPSFESALMSLDIIKDAVVGMGGACFPPRQKLPPQIGHRPLLNTQVALSCRLPHDA